MLATVVELPNGALALPQLLSNLSDAPSLGEAAILWQLSIQPEKGFTVKAGGTLPGCVYVVLACFYLFGFVLLLSQVERFRAASRPPEVLIPAPVFQAIVWAGFMLVSIAAFWIHHALIGVIVLAVGAMLPATKKKKAPKGTEVWPDANPAPAKEGGQRLSSGTGVPPAIFFRLTAPQLRHCSKLSRFNVEKTITR